jgi:MFS family permease
MNITENKSTILLILVAALGYFVDAYDLIVASVVRSTAIVDLGLAEMGSPEHKSIAQLFEYVQSFGILLGGVIFGILGDKIGRKKVLYASILIYSLSNILNGMLVESVPNVKLVYCVLRFICGFALAAELSVGIVMISEIMKAKSRGYGSMIVVSFGVLGCVLAAFLFEFLKISWQNLFYIGGFGGLLLLVFRYSVHESELYLDKINLSSERGSLKQIFYTKRLLKIFIASIMLGFPIYFFVSIPIKFAADYAKEIGLTLKGTLPIIIFYIFMSLSDIFANFISQNLQSRKKVIYFYLIICLIPIVILQYFPPKTPNLYIYLLCPLMGLASGYWALLITFTAEQVGTNIRSTFTTSVPNIIRSLFIPIQLLLTTLQPALGTSISVFFIGILAVSVALIGNSMLKETWGKELNFIENV